MTITIYLGPILDRVGIRPGERVLELGPGPGTFTDPDYPFPAETIRRLKAAGFAMDRRFGNWWIYPINFRKSVES